MGADKKKGLNPEGMLKRRVWTNIGSSIEGSGVGMDDGKEGLDSERTCEVLETRATRSSPAGKPHYSCGLKSPSGFRHLL